MSRRRGRVRAVGPPRSIRDIPPNAKRVECREPEMNCADSGGPRNDDSWQFIRRRLCLVSRRHQRCKPSLLDLDQHEPSLYRCAASLDDWRPALHLTGKELCRPARVRIVRRLDRHTAKLCQEAIVRQYLTRCTGDNSDDFRGRRRGQCHRIDCRNEHFRQASFTGRRQVWHELRTFLTADGKVA